MNSITWEWGWICSDHEGIVDVDHVVVCIVVVDVVDCVGVFLLIDAGRSTPLAAEEDEEGEEGDSHHPLYHSCSGWPRSSGPLGTYDVFLAVSKILTPL